MVKIIVHDWILAFTLIADFAILSDHITVSVSGAEVEVRIF